LFSSFSGAKSIFEFNCKQFLSPEYPIITGEWYEIRDKRHISQKWLEKSFERLVNIDNTESLMNLVSSNFLCL